MKNQLTSSLIEILVGILYTVDSAEDEEIDPDFAVSIMESISADLQDLNQIDLNLLISELEKISKTEPESARREFINNFPINFGLIEEEL